HGHPDKLNLGMEAYGLNFAPEFAYPAACDGGEEHVNWTLSSANHNVVMVNNMSQSWIGPKETGNPMHFDDSGKVKVMDVDMPIAYRGTTSIYRRTVVSIAANDDVNYAVDFFRVKGGNEHVYSFHSQSDEVFETVGLDNMMKQPTGSYAGPEVTWKTTGMNNGFSYLYDVRRAQRVESGEFAVDWKVKDFRKILKTTPNLHMRLTMLNDFGLSEVALAKGDPPAVNKNPSGIEFVLARRSGKNLDSLFTTVLEPYKDERYIKSTEQIPADQIKRVGGAQPGANDVVKGVKVTLDNGRVDYIIYATSNKTVYNVANVFNFSGFVGVYSVTGNEVGFSYMNDGTLIGDVRGEDSYSGSVVGFTKENVAENTIQVKMDANVDLSKLSDQFMYIDNNASMNAAFLIYDAKRLPNGNVEMNVGDQSAITSFKNPSDLKGGFNYIIANGMQFKIPLPVINDNSPVFSPI
ncbi:MAG: hypothetical protein RR994_00495, partial [Clostridia bacterium]